MEYIFDFGKWVLVRFCDCVEFVVVYVKFVVFIFFFY